MKKIKGKKIKGKALIAMSVIILSLFAGVYFLWFYPAKHKPADYRVTPSSPKFALLDADNDGIINIVELAYGTDPYNNDSDMDGIIDGKELLWNYDVDGDGLINALDQDSDGDLLPDYIEDKNKNGIVDIGETNVTNFDTDNDGLIDGLEDSNMNGIRDYNETDPLIADSDNDGLRDGSEPNWFEDTDGDGLINALDPDSDDDLLLDGLEITIGSNPLIPDTDEDNIIDGIEYMKGLNATNPDTDGDFIIDGEEAVINAYWVEAEEYYIDESQIEMDQDAFNQSALQSLPDGQILNAIVFNNLSAGNYKLFIRVKCVFTNAPNPSLNIQVKSNGYTLVSENHLLPYVVFSSMPVNIYRWISTTSFCVENNSDLQINLSTSTNDLLLVDMLFLTLVDTINFYRTNPLLNDTDGDGLLDGYEAPIDSFWWEAEDFVYDSSQIVDMANMSNGKGIQHLADLRLCFISDENYIYCAGPYALFVRAAKINLGNPMVRAKLNVSIQIDYTDGTTEIIHGKADVWGDYPRGRWTPIYFNDSRATSFFYLSKSAKLSINITLNTTAEPVILDKVALLNIWYNRTRFGFYIYDFDPVPRALDPLDPDTDGDQYRILNGTLENSTGYLTDGFEWSIGLNPFDIDTDNDGLRNGTVGYPYTDDIDPNPNSDDADKDGLFDWLEDRNGNLEWEPDLGETKMLDKDTDDDGIIDSNEDWNYDGLNDVYETDPLDNDTDDDGLIDGFELRFWYPQGGNDTDNWPNRTLVNRTFYISDPLDWDTDGDGLPDGWIDFNGNGEKDLGEYEDRDCDGLLYIGPWNNGDGPGETSPWYSDTDFDGLSDDKEILERHSDPLVPQLPDIAISNVSISPLIPVIIGAEEFVSISFTIEIINLGEVKAPRTLRDGSNFILEVSILEETEETTLTLVRFDLSLGILDPNETQIIRTSCQFEAGLHQLTIQIYGYYHKYYNIVKALESNYDNNQYQKNISVKGPPIAYAEVSSYYATLNSSGMATIYFYGWGEDPDNEIVSYSWDFDGDGSWDWIGSNPQNISHVFTAGGDYVATLKVIDEDGYSSQTSIKITIIDPTKIDTDGDGLTNAEEDAIGTDPNCADTDQDGLNDKYETLIGSNPLDNDSDDDMLNDYYEDLVMGFYTLNPMDKPDTDKDGYINILDNDSDDDGLLDGEEIKCIYPYYPTKPEFWFGTNPFYNDSDYDEIDDYSEKMIYKTSPISSDTDNDGLDDYEELFLYSTDPLNMDCDGDRVPDGYDLQPLIIGYAYSLSNVFLPGMLRETSVVSIFGLKGEVWKSSIFGWEKTSADNVKSSTINEDTIRSWEWGTYIPDKINFINKTSLGYLERISDTSPSYKVRYTYEKYCYNVTFSNPRHTYVSGYPYMLIPVMLSAGYDQSIVFQLSLNQDRTSFSEYGFIVLCFIYKLYRYEDVVLSGNKVIEIKDYPIYQNYTLATHVIQKTYRIALSFPSSYQGSRYILCIQPVWYYYWVSTRYMQPIPMDLFRITGVATLIKQNEKTLIYGHPDLESLNKTIDFSAFLDPSAHDKNLIRTVSILEYTDDYYYAKILTTERYVTRLNDSHMVLKICKEQVYGIATSEDSLDQILPPELKKSRYTPLIARFKNIVSEAITKASDKKSILVRHAITKMLAGLQYTYDGQAFSVETQVALMIGGEFLDPDKLVKIVKLSKTTVKTLEKVSIVFEIVVAAVEVSIFLYRASQTNDKHMQTYYIFKALFVIYEKIIETIIVFALPGIGVAIVMAWEILKICVPQIEEAIDNLIRALVAEWEALTGTVPEEFARTIFKDACNKVLNLSKRCPGISIPILPRY